VSGEIAQRGQFLMRAAHAMRGVRVRWRIFSLLVAFATIVYFQQRSVSIAAERIMPELSLTQMQIGWLQWAFVFTYGFLQFPGGVFGQRVGARRALTAIMLVAVFATALVPMAPLLFTGTVLFAVLLGTQLLLGVAHAPFMPVCAGVMAAWLPSRRWALAQGIHTCGCQVGAAMAPPILVLLMQALGWQRALFWAALPPLALIGVWVWYGRNTPGEHPAVSAAELAELGPQVITPHDTGVSFDRIRHILGNRDILILTVSYICMNYVFYLLASWSFLYLIQQRHFTALEGGWLASLPPIGAAIGAGTGGSITDALARRLGTTWGYRVGPLVSLPLAGLLLLIATHIASAYAAVAALTLAFATVELTEGAYWGGTMHIAKGDSMAATGVLNTGGNFGGVIGIPVVAYLSGHGAWNAAFFIGFLCALAAALAWLGIDTSRALAARAASGV
jgi:MFS transporter, ACS family, glucarate transporter